MTDNLTDPMEKLIAEALQKANIPFEMKPNGIDFYLPAYDVYIEVKQFHSSRIARQMSTVDNVIVAQGRKAVEMLASLIK